MAEEPEVHDIQRYEHEWPDTKDGLEEYFRKHPEFEFLGTDHAWKLCGGCGRAARIGPKVNRFCLDCMEKEFEECDEVKRPLPLHWFEDEGKRKLLGHRPDAIYPLRGVILGNHQCHPKWNAKVIRGRDWEIPANRLVGNYEHKGLKIPGTIIRNAPMEAVAHPKFFEEKTHQDIPRFFLGMKYNSSNHWNPPLLERTKEIVMMGWRT